MSFACPHFDIDRDACLRLKTDCVPGRPGCVLAGSTFAVSVEQRLREREDENRRRAASLATRGLDSIGAPHSAALTPKARD
jgi:hypothetical protein